MGDGCSRWPEAATRSNFPKHERMRSTSRIPRTHVTPTRDSQQEHTSRHRRPRYSTLYYYYSPPVILGHPAPPPSPPRRLGSDAVVDTVLDSIDPQKHHTESSWSTSQVV